MTPSAEPQEPLDQTCGERDERVLALPLNKHLGLVFDGRSRTGTHVHFTVTDETAAFGGLHGGALYALIDVTCLLTLLPLLGESEHAVTHDLHISMMRTAPAGATVAIVGSVVRRGKQIAFVEARAHANGKLIAAARVTKSIVSNPQAHATSETRP